MSAQEQIEIIGNLDNIDELTEKYQKSTNKNMFVLMKFKKYIFLTQVILGPKIS